MGDEQTLRSNIFSHAQTLHLWYIYLAMPKNVLGGELETCSKDPITGFFRSGCCETDETDFGAHVVCVKTTKEFLSFSKAAGNDLSTPRPEFNFRGLKPGDRWCVCAERWKEALDAGMAPPVVLSATHERALDYVTIEDLLAHAVDLN